MIRVDPSYTQRRVGEQLLTHYALRNAVRHATPLFPFSLAGLFSRVSRAQPARADAAQALPSGTASSRA